MASQETLQPRKRRGPQPTGKGIPVQVRLQPKLLAATDNFIASADEEISRPEAVRTILEQGLRDRGFLKD